ncbi:hypothetical protein AQ1_00853 [alpha proteobacterium Q-1]|nr:hypothetical protein AQ1_00853 [alpha proteobacterium Q-1]
MTLNHGRCRPQILDPAIGARSDKHPIHRQTIERHPRFQPHIMKGTSGGFALAYIRKIIGIRHPRANGGHLFRAGSPCYMRLYPIGIDGDLPIEMGIGIAIKTAPQSHGPLPLSRLGGKGSATQIIECFLIGGDQTRTRPGFDGHIAQGHPPFHAQGLHGITGKFNHMASTAIGPNPADDRQRHIFGRNPDGQGTAHRHPHIALFFQSQGLGDQHMFDFGCANAKGQSPKSPMG